MNPPQKGVLNISLALRNKQILGKKKEFLRAMPTPKYHFVVCDLAILGQNPGDS